MKAIYSIIPVCALITSVAGADTLSIPLRNPPPNSPAGLLRPVRGMTMDAVLAQFGEPPITRWVYERFTVYFEGPITLHVVVSK